MRLAVHPLALVASLFAATTMAAAGDLDKVVNPLEDAEVGEWCEYAIEVKTSTVEGEDESKATSRMEVVEVEGFRVAIKVTGSAQRGEQKIHLMATAPYRNLILGGYDQVEILESSVERQTVEVGGRSYQAQAVHVVFTAVTRQYGLKIPCKVDQTIWVSLDVPVTGLLKQETTVDLELMGQPITSNTRTTLSGSSTQ